MRDGGLFLLDSKSRYDAEQFKALYDNRTRVEKLDIRKCQDLIPYNFRDKAINFSRLKKLSLHECNITILELEDFLQKCPELEEIAISCCNNLDQRFSAAISNIENSFRWLEKLSLYKCNITTHELEVFLQLSPRLQQIELDGCHNLGYGFSKIFKDKVGWLSRLKKLNLLDSHITITELENLLQQCPNLETLEIRFCENLSRGFSDTFIKKAECFLHLKKISLVRNKMNLGGFGDFLQRCPNVEDMHIATWGTCEQQFPVISKNTEKKLNYLNRLTLSDFEFVDLISLLLISPNLEEIDFSRCNKVLAYDGVKTNCFMALKSVRLVKVNISTVMLEYLLFQCPNLERLAIRKVEEEVCSSPRSDFNDEAPKEVFQIAIQERREFLTKKLLLLWSNYIYNFELDEKAQIFLSEVMSQIFLEKTIEKINEDCNDEIELLRLLDASVSYSIEPLNLFVSQLIRDDCHKSRAKLFLKIIYHATVSQELSEKMGEIYLSIGMYLWGKQNELSDLAVLFLRKSIIYSCDFAQNLYSQACRRLMGLPTIVLGGGEKPHELFDSVSQEEQWRIDMMEYKAGILEMMLNDREWGSSLQDSYANNIESIADLFVRKKLFLYVGEMLYKKSKNESLPLDIAIYFLERAGKDDREARILLWSMGKSYKPNFFLPGSPMNTTQKGEDASQHRRNKSF